MKESVRICRFAVIGTLNALITAIAVWMMMDVVRAGYMISNVVAYLIAQTHNFLWSKHWIFIHEQADPALPEATYRKSSTCRQVLLFSFAFALAYGAQFLFLVVLVEWFGCNEYLAQFLGLIVYGAVNFVMNRRVTFK